MDLFEASEKSHGLNDAPLAEQIRPRSIANVLGQSHILGKASSLRSLIRSDHFPSLILWGPPGCGKTTLALAIASEHNFEFLNLNAVDTGAKALREAGESARARKRMHGLRTLMFIDEIHRLNKGQQDVLLPFVERGDFTLIGATTENPSYEINSALLSRCRLVVLNRLEPEDLKNLATRAFEFLGLTPESVVTVEGLAALADLADGDGRRMVSQIEQLGRAFIQRSENSEITFPADSAMAVQVVGSTPLYFDKKSDAHYDTISAFIKSIRGSDPDAGLYYLARLLAGGEDPRFIARRLVILASEDIGNADPKALEVAIAGFQAIELIGLPEGAINLAQVVTYLASAPKSNRSYEGLKKAQAEVQKTGSLPIPLALRSAQTPAMKELGYGKDYKYSHSGAKGWLPQNFLPEGVTERSFYAPSDLGFEKRIKEYLAWLKSST